jgi:hypothetical protein
VKLDYARAFVEAVIAHDLEAAEELLEVKSQDVV